jgi:hypothetical protein
MAQALIAIEDECKLRLPAIRRMWKIRAIVARLDRDLDDIYGHHPKGSR